MSSLQMPDTLRPKILRLQWIAIAWMCIECLLSFVAGDKARSMALLTFSGNSAIQLALAVAILLRLYGWTIREKLSTRVAATLLVLLAPLTLVGVAVGVLIPGFEPKPSALGVAVLILAAVVMPWLSRARREVAVSIPSSTLRADAAQSSIRAYLSAIALVGVGVSTFFNWPWADSLAALALLPFIFREAWQAWQGQHCPC